MHIANVKFYLKIHIELDFEDIEFTQLNFVKIKFQNMGILLNILKRGVLCYIVVKLRVFTHFAHCSWDIIPLIYC